MVCACGGDLLAVAKSNFIETSPLKVLRFTDVRYSATED
ncbi:hypothetical protein MCBRY_001140 [Methylocystis bryophila]